jgi:hypothetical protein
MTKLFFVFVLAIGVLTAVPHSAYAQSMEQLQKFLESLPPEEENTEEYEEEVVPEPFNYEKYMKQFTAYKRPELPGEFAGWPGADKFKPWGFSIKQPAGTEAKHDGDGEQWSNLTIYLKGDNPDAIMQDLVRQAETAIKAKAEMYDDANETHNAEGELVKTDSYYMYVPVGKSDYWNFRASQIDGGYVAITFAYSVQ